MSTQNTRPRDIEADIRVNHAQRSPCVLVLDTSGSMSENGRIDRLNEGLRVFQQTISSTETLRQQVLVMVIGFGSEAEYLADWAGGDKFVAPRLEASGTTAMGEAMRMAHAAVEDLRSKLKNEGVPFTRPWIFLLSDGGPNDSGWEQAAAESRRACEERKADVWPIAIPPGADGHALQRFARPDMKVYSLGEDANFGAFFEWLGRTVTELADSRSGQTLQIKEPGHVYVQV